MARKKSPKPEAARGVLVQKPRTNIYTVLLIVGSLAMFVGCTMLYLELVKYGGVRAVIGN